MKNNLSVILISLILSACISKHSESLPLPKDELKKILLDVHVAESAMGKLQNGPKKDSLAELYYNQIAEIHQIDRETLDSCLAILQRNPEMADEIYTEISEELEKKQLGK